MGGGHDGPHRRLLGLRIVAAARVSRLRLIEPPRRKRSRILPLLSDVASSTTRCRSDPDSRVLAQPTGSDARILVALSPFGDCDPDHPGACDGTIYVDRTTTINAPSNMARLKRVNADRFAIARLKRLGFTAHLHNYTGSDA